MEITAYKTRKIIPGKDSDIFGVLDEYLPPLKEGSVVAVTSKIVAICEGRLAQEKNEDTRDRLARQEADWYLPRDSNPYHFMITVKKGVMFGSAGIDKSNANDMLILWPKDPQASANKIRSHLAKRHRVKRLGVVITDSKTTPLRRGTTGVCIAYGGFRGLNDYRGKSDIFGRKLKVTRANIADGLAVTAVLAMGEGKEQTPLAVFSDLPFVQFQQRNPSQKELAEFHVTMEEDIYSAMLLSAPWKKGKGGI